MRLFLLPFFLLVSLLGGVGICLAQEADTEVQIAVASDELVIYEAGNMPIIILAPHDGVAKPEGLPLRKNGIRDVNSAKLARQIVAELNATSICMAIWSRAPSFT